MAKLRASFRNDLPMPPPPEGGTKVCAKCFTEKACTPKDDNFGTSIRYTPKGTWRYWRNVCKDCYNKRKVENENRKSTRNKKLSQMEQKAKQRALQKTAASTPVIFKQFYREELASTYKNLGIPRQDIPRMVDDKTQYVIDYIKQKGDD